MSVRVSCVLILIVAATVWLLQAATSDSERPPIRLQNIASEAGLNFLLNHNPTPEKHMIETMAGGLAVFDSDGDGLSDVFFTNGASIPNLEKVDPRFMNRLFRNVGEYPRAGAGAGAGAGKVRFEDVTESAGLSGKGYSMGASAADYDNDGDVDLFVAGVYENLLYRNNGEGRFEDVTAASGIASDKWSVAAGWFDFDRDGLLDLFVVNYADWTLEFDRYCGDRSKDLRVYCHPKYLKPVGNTLYRNRGDGTFEDVSAGSGILEHSSRGMSVAFADYDADGYQDAFVTNDNLPNSLFHNRRDGTFEEMALLSGVALLDTGQPVASMGADFRDYDNDGLPDLTVTALTGETFPLFRNTGDGFFRDATFASKMSVLTIRFSGWSNGLVDLNGDGWKDLFTANSHVNDKIDYFEATAYPQPNTVFVNQGDGSFAQASEIGPGFDTPLVHRGSAYADFNLDGKLDVIVTALGAPAQLWINRSPAAHSWLLVRLRGRKSNRDGIGARVSIGSQHNLMTSAVGYASSSHYGVYFGLGKASRVEKIDVLWPSGTRQTVKDVTINSILMIEEPTPE